MRELGQRMMGDVVGRDVVEGVGANDSKVKVNSCCCAMNKCPLFSGVLWESWVNVVEICDHNNLGWRLALSELIGARAVILPCC
jgi:hypothetical protein